MPAEDVWQLRRGPAAMWNSRNPILRPGEQGLETDTGRTKYGDGVTRYNDLDYHPTQVDVGDMIQTAIVGSLQSMPLSPGSVLGYVPVHGVPYSTPIALVTEPSEDIYALVPTSDGFYEVTGPAERPEGTLATVYALPDDFPEWALPFGFANMTLRNGTSPDVDYYSWFEINWVYTNGTSWMVSYGGERGWPPPSEYPNDWGDDIGYPFKPGEPIGPYSTEAPPVDYELVGFMVYVDAPEDSTLEIRPEVSRGYYSEGSGSALTLLSHAEGEASIAKGWYSHAEGTRTRALGDSSHAEGYGTIAEGTFGSHAEGWDAVAEGEASHAEGYLTRAGAAFSHVEGQGTQATGQSAHAQGELTLAAGVASHAEGEASHAEGVASHAGGGAGHAENRYSFARGGGSYGWDPANPGQRQYVNRQLHASTTNTTATTLTDGDSGRVLLHNNRIAFLRGMVVARKTDGTAGKAWEIKAAVSVNATGTVTLNGATVTDVGSFGTVTGWTVALAAGGSGTRYVSVNVTGAASTSIHWSASVETQEVW